jgi:hypothetical protein
VKTEKHDFIDLVDDAEDEMKPIRVIPVKNEPAENEENEAKEMITVIPPSWDDSKSTLEQEEQDRLLAEKLYLEELEREEHGQKFNSEQTSQGSEEAILRAFRKTEAEQARLKEEKMKAVAERARMEAEKRAQAKADSLAQLREIRGERAESWKRLKGEK